MGQVDTVTKKYIGRQDIFSDLFNQFIYGGEQVVKPEFLREVDSTQIVLPYGPDGTTIPLQKCRDLEKLMLAMTDGVTAYCLLGVENQGEIHYAMPVKNGLYDFMQLSGEVEKAAKRYHKEPYEKVSGGEFLSGFRKEDRLVPVVTLVFYFGDDEWDGPISLREMYRDCDPRILKYAPDYRINLISPYDMTDGEIELYRTNLREIMQYVKHSSDKDFLPQLIGSNERFKNMDRDAVDLINKVTGSRIPIPDGEEKVNMCAGFEGAMADSKMEGIQEGRQEGLQTGRLSALQSIMKKMQMTAEQALDFLDIPKEDWAGYLTML